MAAKSLLQDDLGHTERAERPSTESARCARACKNPEIRITERNTPDGMKTFMYPVAQITGCECQPMWLELCEPSELTGEEPGC